MSDLETKAIKIANIKDWHPYNFEKVELGIMVTGCVCPLKTRGQNKGEPNFRKRVVGSTTKILIPKKNL